MGTLQEFDFAVEATRVKEGPDSCRDVGPGLGPRVSVIVPNYNHARFLDHRIRSVLDQTYQDFEVIYLDDCSTDASEEVLSRFRHHPKIQVTHNAVNGGNPFKQFNKGIQMSRGQYIWVAEADDYAETDFLATMVDVLDRHRSVGLAYCQSWAIDDSDTIMGSMGEKTKDLPNGQRWESDFVNDGRDECRQYLLRMNTIPNLSAVVFRREVIREAGYFEEGLLISGDYLTWVKMLLMSNVAFVANPLNYYRHHPGSFRRSLPPGTIIRENYEVLRYLSDRLPLSDAELDLALDRLCKRWRRKVFDANARISTQMTASIYRIARELDPKLGRRWTRQLYRKIMARVPLLG